MRCLVAGAVGGAALLFVPTWAPRVAHADVSIGAAVGAGAQGAATYGALDLRLDAAWPDVRLGLGARGVWDDAVFRRSDWSGAASVVTLVRDLEVARDVGDLRLALAAGALAPAHIGHVVDGYRVTLDDRFRTGVRVAALREHLAVTAELDDVLDPALIAAGTRWEVAPPFAAHLTLAVDPRAPAMDGTHAITAIEAGAGRVFEGEDARAEVGLSVVAEIALGASVAAFADAEAEREGVRWTARADVRAGTGTVGSLYGPLYRIERLAHDGRASLWDRARSGDLSGASAGLAIGAALPAGWLELGARTRPGMADLVFATAGAPMNRWLQAGMWGALSREDAAGAAELRVAWAKQLFSALQVARIYRLDAMEPLPVWSVTAWFGATSN
jgi:hypothetical protein